VVPSIRTIAGNGTAGSTGNSGAATSIELNYPDGVAMDGAGNLYIADLYNNVVRKVAAGTGLITTVAGNGTACPSSTSLCGDGGLATAAELNQPYDLTLDGAGNLYIVDGGGSLVRVVSNVSSGTGIITTVVGTGTQGYSGDGGLATKAQLNGANQVVLDSAGNLYIADWGNNRIRKVAAGTGIITTFAGTGTAGYSGDGGLATATTLNERWRRFGCCGQSLHRGHVRQPNP
jgi:sugar lactone lactonase YvrE